MAGRQDADRGAVRQTECGQAGRCVTCDFDLGDDVYCPICDEFVQEMEGAS